MDFQEKILLNKNKFVDAVNVDTTLKVDLQSTNNLNIEYNIQNILDVTQIFDNERQSTTKYRIHGEFEYFSILNNIENNYTNLEYFFKNIEPSGITKNIFSDLKIYLVKPSTDFTEIIPDKKYIKNYDILTEINNFDIVNAGFSKNIFNEQQYLFIINKDIDIDGLVDGLGFPLTELALYIEYQPQLNGLGISETMKKKKFNSNGDTIIEDFIPIPLNTGNTIDGDIINYEKNSFLQTDVIESMLEHYITTPYSDTLGTGSGSGNLIWKYRPIIPIKLRYFEQEVRRGNTGSTSHQEVISIPSYATKIDDEGNFIWRKILDNGFFDPIDNIGVSFPFINQRHYVFKNIIFKIQPNLEDINTRNIFNEILFSNNILNSSTPNSNLDKIGDICD